MRSLTKGLFIVSLGLCGSAFAASSSVDLSKLKTAAIQRYAAAQNLQAVAVSTAKALNVKWVEVFCTQGWVIAHSSMPSRIGELPKALHRAAVFEVVKTGKEVSQIGVGSVHESFYPIKKAGKVINVVEVVK